MAPSRRGLDDPHSNQDHNHDHHGTVKAWDWQPDANHIPTNAELAPAQPCLGQDGLNSGSQGYWMYSDQNYVLQEVSVQNSSQGQVLTLRGAAFTWDQSNADGLADARPSLTYDGQTYEPMQWDAVSSDLNGPEEEDTRCRIFTYNISLPLVAIGARHKRQDDSHTLHFEQADIVPSETEQLPNPTATTAETSSTAGPGPGPSSPDSSAAVQPSSSSTSSSSRAGTIALAIVVPLFVLALATLLLLVWRRRQQKRTAPSAEFRAAMAQRFPDPPMAPMESDAVSIAETDLPGYAVGSSVGAAQARGYVPGDAKRPALGL
ncbi:hypothetical protein BKA62DRAFT_711297 [Auriculariales sp. MPI-PUGE-AT-0066]|nr:hypothetical protein BKA62DRAFT_711297 [Auriculariales sp. MPI-PUGE-AT-0066]